MKKFFYIILAVLILWPSAVFCQDKDEWLEGSITFNDGNTYNAKIQILNILTEGTILVRDATDTQLFGPDQIQNFSYYDKYRKKTRMYSSVPTFVDGNDRAKKIFMEIIFLGDKVTLLRKTYFVKKYKNGVGVGSMKTARYKVETLYLWNYQTGQVDPYTDPLLYQKKESKYLNPKKRVLFDYIGDNKIIVRNYAAEKKLNYGKIDDIVKILEFNEDL